jgi:hypothetical protein
MKQTWSIMYGMTTEKEKYRTLDITQIRSFTTDPNASS